MPLDELSSSSFYLEIKISDFTNLKDDKSKFLVAIHKAMLNRISDVHPINYNAIDEMKTDAYGYQGLTIEYKYITNQENSYHEIIIYIVIDPFIKSSTSLWTGTEQQRGKSMNSSANIQRMSSPRIRFPSMNFSISKRSPRRDH